MPSLALAFDILAVNRASRVFDTVADDAQQSSGRVSRSFSRAGEVMGAALKTGALAAAAGTALFVKGAISEARDAQKVGAQTTAVLKSTGNAANVTAKQIGDLANAISLKTGIDDEQIQANQNLLLTFTNVRNEVGKGNRIFDQATRTITDMSVALGQSGKSSAIQLGKALNDPIKGITALSRVGVSFTAQQKKQIEALVESGETVKAQKIILAELNKEFGGSAAAAATAGDKFKVAFGNLQEQLGTALLPTLDRALTSATEFIGFLSVNAGPAFAKVKASVGPFISDLADGLVPAVKELVDGFKKNALPTLEDFADVVVNDVLPIVKDFAGFVVSDVVPAVVDIAKNVASNLKPVLDQLVKTFRESILPTIKKVIERFKEWWPTIKDVAGFLLDLWSTIQGKVLPIIIQLGGKIIEKVIPAVLGIIEATATFIGWLIDLGKKVGEAGGKLDGLWNNILKPLGEFIARVFVGHLRTLGVMFLRLAGFGVRAFRALLGAAFTCFDGILAAAETGLGWIPGIGDKIKGARDAFQDFARKTSGALDDVAGKLRDVRERIDGIPEKKPIDITVRTSYVTVGKPDRAFLPGLGGGDGESGRAGRSGGRSGGRGAAAGPSGRTSALAFGANPRAAQSSARGGSSSDRVPFRITNWREGIGFFEGLIDDAIDGAAAHAVTTGAV